MIRKHMIISGDVQSRGLRETAWRAAKQLHITGWIHNRLDRRVEFEIQGEEADVNRFLSRVMRLNPAVRATVDESYLVDTIMDEKSFSVRK